MFKVEEGAVGQIKIPSGFLQHGHGRKSSGKHTSGTIRRLPADNSARRRAVREDSQVEEAAKVCTSRDIDGVSLSESQCAVDIDVDSLTAWNLDLERG